ncbi:MAG: oligosaccharide flippase family protein [Bacteroidales bacterium]|nr:oligosaccharide flippase family protein [Bacteroidales bacterium]
MAIKLSKTFKLASYSYLNQAIAMILQLVQVKILTNFLTLNSYGGWNQVHVAENLLIVLVNLNIGHGFIRFASSYTPEQKQKTYSSVLIFQSILVLSIFAIAFPLRKQVTHFLIGSPSEPVYLLMGLLLFMAISIDNIQRFLLVSGHEIQMIKQNLIRSISDVAFTVLGVIIKHDIVGALAGYASSKLFCFVLFSWINKIDYRKLSFSSDIIKTLLKFSLPLLSISIAYWVINSSNRYLINHFIGLDAVGMFSVANRFPMMLVIIFTLLSTIFLSNISRLFDAANFERVSYWFSIILRLFFVVGIAGGSFLIAANRPLTLIVSNEQYLFDGLPLVYLFVSLGSLAFGGFQIISRLYDLEKKVYQNSFNWILAMLLNIILNVSLIPLFGIVGAALATGATFVIGFLLSIIKRPKQIEINIPWLKILLLISVSFLSAFFYAIFKETEVSILTGLLLAGLFSVASLLLSLVLRIINIKELINIIKK